MVSSKNSDEEIKNIKLILISQEIELVKILCSNEPTVRHRGLGKVRRWLTSRSRGIVELGEDDFNRLWKGLFYCLWMADKPLYQEEVVEIITRIVNCFSNYRMSVIFIKSFFNILGQEWPGVDQHRIDKCMMLVRRLIRQSFLILFNKNWDLDSVVILASCYRVSLDRIPNGLIYHVVDVFVNELAKVGGEKIDGTVVASLVKPFAEFMASSNDGRLINYMASGVFLNLIRLSKEGVEHETRFKAWRDRGFPGGTIDVMKKVKESNGNNVDDEEEEEGVNDDVENKIFDPRAGLVDVEVPTMNNIDHHQFIRMFASLKKEKFITTKARKQFNNLIKRFRKLLAGNYPLGLQTFDSGDAMKWKNVIRQSAEELIELECNSRNDDRGANDMCITSNCDDVEGIRRQVGMKTDSCGVWQVTPIKNGITCQSFSNKTSYPQKLPAKWIIVDKNRPVCNNGNSGKGIDVNNLESSGRVSKRKSFETEAVGLKSNKIIKKYEQKLRQKSDIDEEVTVDLLQRRNCKKERGQVTQLMANNTSNHGYSMHSPRLDSSKVNQQQHTPCVSKIDINNSGGKCKRVEFVLKKNTVQEENEYQQLIKAQPMVQFDGSKQPVHPIFKDKGVKSPINPFYKRLGYKQICGEVK